ncbi:Odorant-binding protein 19d [Carabus blaptoides fortunei]
MNSSIIIIFLAITLAAVLGQDHGPGSEEFKKVADECKNKLNASDDDMKFMMNRSAPTSRTAQCLMACIKKGIGCMNPDNTINVDNAKKQLEGMKENKKEMYDKVVKSLTECKALETPETDECAAAKKFNDCMMTNRD